MMKNTLHSLTATVVTLLILSALGAEQPNIIVVMPDDAGYGDYSCLGNPVVQTPAIDQLKMEGMLFSRYHVSPRCAPSRAQLISGRHEFMSGVTHTINNRQRLSLDTVTIAQALKSAGYATALFGKWHIGDEEPYRADCRGFDIGLSTDGGGTQRLNPRLYLNGVRKDELTGYPTDVFFEKALAWMDEKRHEQAPFFVYLAPNDPHGPFHGPHGLPTEDYKKFLGTHPEVDEKTAMVYWMVENIDRNMNVMLSKLDHWGIAENTLVVYIGSDNGNSKGWAVYNAGMKGHKGQVYQGGTRVPVFFRWPGRISANTECSALASQMDMMPTLMEISGTPWTKELKEQVEGRSLVPLLNDPAASWGKRYLVHHAGAWEYGKSKESKYKRVAVQNERFTLVNNEELYDLENDFGETQNVIDQYPEVVERLRAYYDKWWDKVVPRMVNEKDSYPTSKRKLMLLEKERKERGLKSQ